MAGGCCLRVAVSLLDVEEICHYFEIHVQICDTTTGAGQFKTEVAEKRCILNDVGALGGPAVFFNDFIRRRERAAWFGSFASPRHAFSCSVSDF